MALQPREKKLAVVVAGLGVVVVSWLALQSYLEAVRTRQGQIDAAQSDLQNKQFSLARARAESGRLAEWEKRSLPRNVDMAASLYRVWLVETVEKAGLEQAKITLGLKKKLPGVGTMLPFALRAQGTLAQTTAWLADFYRADHLHQLKDVSLTPAEDGGLLELTAQIEALAMDDAANADKLSTSVGARLDEARAAELVAAITKRNLFAPYVPPAPPAPPPQVVVETPPPPPPPVFDTATQTSFDASVVSVTGQPEVWLRVRPTNQTLKLHIGDKIEVGTITGKILRIADREFEIDAGGKRRIIALGKMLTDGIELPATPAQPATPTL